MCGSDFNPYFFYICAVTNIKNIEARRTTETTPFAVPVPMRSTFLTVICILTFIGSGWGVIGSISSYATADMSAAVTRETVSNTESQTNELNTLSIFKQMFGSLAGEMTLENIKESALLKLISTLLTLLGGIMMFKLKKFGFYLYIVGTIIYSGTPIIIVTSFFAIAGAVFAALIGIAFIVMYGSNLKYMIK
jgi:hypothetical protein